MNRVVALCAVEGSGLPHPDFQQGQSPEENWGQLIEMMAARILYREFEEARPRAGR